MAAEGSANPFARGAVLLMFAIGFAAFIALAGRAHGAGLYALARAEDDRADVGRAVRVLGSGELRRSRDAEDLARVDEVRVVDLVELGHLAPVHAGRQRQERRIEIRLPRLVA